MIGPGGECAVHSVTTTGILPNNCRHMQCGAVEHQGHGFQAIAGRTVQVNTTSIFFKFYVVNYCI